jgi:uncharacterized repeat protein (TIGR01451 family)
VLLYYLGQMASMKDLIPLTFWRMITLAVVGAIHFTPLPSIAAPQPTTSIVSRTPKHSELDLTLQVEKLQNQVWQLLRSDISMQQGDRLRYRVKGNNQSQFSLAQVVITQPIPKQATYVLDSTTGLHSAAVTFSIDDGKTYLTNPIISVQQNHEMITQKAPAEAYTHIRWQLLGELASQGPIDLTYQVKVR